MLHLERLHEVPSDVLLQRALAESLRDVVPNNAAGIDAAIDVNKEKLRMVCDSMDEDRARST